MTRRTAYADNHQPTTAITTEFPKTNYPHAQLERDSVLSRPCENELKRKISRCFGSPLSRKRKPGTWNLKPVPITSDSACLLTMTSRHAIIVKGQEAGKYDRGAWSAISGIGGKLQVQSFTDWLSAGWYLAGGGWKPLLASAIDISLVALAIYKLIMLAKRSRAWQIMWGLGVFLIFGFISDALQLHTISYLISSSLPLLPVAIVILFYPELRHALEEIGRVSGWGRGFSSLAQKDLSDVIQEVARAAVRMSEQRIGALIVLEREGGLDDVVATGVRVDATVSSDLLGTIFHPGGPLHDGAVIIRGNRVIAAGCTLPLSESVHIGTMIHTRHKAALGVTEESDAAVVVVSEETGTISLSTEGKLHRGMTEDSMVKNLSDIFGVTEQKGKSSLAKTVDGTLRKARFKL